MASTVIRSFMTYGGFGRKGESDKRNKHYRFFLILEWPDLFPATGFNRPVECAEDFCDAQCILEARLALLARSNEPGELGIFNDLQVFVA